MDNLIDLILKYGGTSIDYRIEIGRVKLLPSPKIELKITYIPTKETIELLLC